MARHRRRRNDGDEIPYGEWIPAHAVMFEADGTVEIMTEAGERVGNPEETFRDLPEGAHFIFESERAYPYSGMMRGPWIKTGPRRYVHVHDETGFEYRVGSTGAGVIIENPGRRRNQQRRLYAESGSPYWRINYHYSIPIAGGSTISSDDIVNEYNRLDEPLPYELIHLLEGGTTYSGESGDVLSKAIRKLAKDDPEVWERLQS